MGVIHLWGSDEQPSLVSAESIAVYWFVNLFNIEITVVFSNNVDLSPSKELPILIAEDGTVACGFQDIVSVLYKQERSLADTALLQYTAAKFNWLTEYQLYLNKTNYDKYTRRVFSTLLPWPMWYNTPLTQRALASERAGACRQESEDAEASDAGRKELMQSSRVFRQLEDKQAKTKHTLEQVKYNMQYMEELDRALIPWIAARKALGDEVNLSDILICANLYVQLQLPDGANVKKHLMETDEVFHNNIMVINDRCANILRADNVRVRPPTYAESASIPMTVYRYISSVF